MDVEAPDTKAHPSGTDHWRYMRATKLLGALTICAALMGAGCVGSSRSATPDTSAEVNAADPYLEEALSVMRHAAVLREELDFEAIRDSLHAYAGQPNVRLVGQPTNGLTSTNSFEFLSDDSVLNLTVGYFANRRGTDVPAGHHAGHQRSQRRRSSRRQRR